MYADHLRHFGLQLVEEFVKHRWDQLDHAGKDQIKLELFTFAAGACKPLLAEQHFIVQKLSVVFAHIAIREWPQRWLDLTDSLGTLATHGPTAQAVTLTVLKVLMEEMDNPTSGLPGARLGDLTKARNEVLPSMVPSVAAVALGGIQLLAAAGTAQAHSAEAQEAELLTKAALRTLSVFVNWVPLPTIFESNLLPAFCTLLHHPTLRQVACECLVLIFERNKDNLLDRVPLLTVFEAIG